MNITPEYSINFFKRLKNRDVNIESITMERIRRYADVLLKSVFDHILNNDGNISPCF